jgi:hypothetical protein
MNILLSGGSDTIDSMAMRVFDGTPHSTLSPNTLRAVFLANNLSARAYLNGDRLPRSPNRICFSDEDSC